MNDILLMFAVIGSVLLVASALYLVACAGRCEKELGRIRALLEENDAVGRGDGAAE